MPHDELTYSNITYGVCIYGVWTSTWCFHIKQLHHCRFLHKRDDLLVAALAAKNIGFIPSQVPLWTAEAPLQPFCSQSARRRLLPTSSSPTSQEDWNGCGPPELPKELFALLLAVSVCLSLKDPCLWHWVSLIYEQLMHVCFPAFYKI